MSINDVNGSVTKGVEVGKDLRSDGDDAGLDVVTGTAIVLNVPQNGKHGPPREIGVCAHGADDVELAERRGRRRVRVELAMEWEARSPPGKKCIGDDGVWDCAGHWNCTGFFFSKKKTTAEPKTMAMWSGTQNGQKRVANELLKNLSRLNSAAVTRRQVAVCAGYLLFFRWCE